MHRLLTAVTLALLGIMLAVPHAALAQNVEPADGVTNPEFRTDETRNLSAQINEAEATYDQNEARMEALADESDYGPEYDRLSEANDEMDDNNPLLREDLAESRLDAIQSSDAPASEKVDALERLEVYVSDTYAVPYDSPVEDRITDELAAQEDAVAIQQEQQADEEEQQAESTPPADSGNSGDSGGSSSEASGGPLAALGSVVAGIVSFFISLFVLWALSLAVMGFVAYRRTGSAGAAASAAFRPKRIALGFLIAFVLTLFGGLGAIFAWLQLIAIIALVLLAIFWWWDGSLGSALARIGFWFAPLFRIGRGSDDDEYGSGGGPGPGGPQPGGPDDGRRGRNVAGAKGEAKVNEILGSLAREGRQYCYVFANLSQRGIGNIDHVHLNQYGLVVVETKSNKGAVVLDEEDQLTADDKPFVRDPFEQAHQQIDAILGTLGNAISDTGLEYVEYYVCLAGTNNVSRAASASNAHRLVKLDELGAALESLPSVLSMQQVDAVADQIMGVYGTAPIASPTKPQPNGPKPGGPNVGGSANNHKNSNSQSAQQPVTKDAAQKMLLQSIERLQDQHGIQLSYTDEAVSVIVNQARDQQTHTDGSQALRGIIEGQVEEPISESIKAGKIQNGDSLELAVKDGQVRARRVKNEADESIDIDQRRCPECDGEVSAKAKFCGQCGASIGAPENS